MYCLSCGEPMCLAHLHINHEAEGVCDECVASLLPEETRSRRQQQASPHADEEAKLRWAYRRLKLKRNATEKEIRLRFRKLMAESHPDRSKNEAQRKRREAESAEITEAYHVILKHVQREAA
jgi:DnaJ-class molecular chaperone